MESFLSSFLEDEKKTFIPIFKLHPINPPHMGVSSNGGTPISQPKMIIYF